MDGDLLYEVNGAVGVVTFNRPLAHNALTFEMYDGLGQICASIPADGSVRALIITGAGGLAYEERLESALDKLERCEIPTIAAIAGVCTGGAAVIAAACDLRIATRSLKYGFPIART